MRTGDRINLLVEVTRVCRHHDESCRECDQPWGDMKVIETVGETIFKVCECGFVHFDGPCDECLDEIAGDDRRDAARDRAVERKALKED